jgi:hypothetical protein
MINNPKTAPLSYRDSVMIWGNQSPWKRLGIRVSHKVAFQPHEVVRDGQGNILSMPTIEKPCFGRPEAVFRHGKRTKKITLRSGRTVDGTKHQCGSCPAGVHRACVETALERVNSDPKMRQTFDAWRDHCGTHHGGVFTYTGPASRLWGDFKNAIAERGPFQNSNDAALDELREQKREDQRRKWVKAKRRQRQNDRRIATEARQLPSGQFVINLQDERDRRHDTLLEVLGQPDQPPSRSKVPAEKRQATARITANAWAVRELLRACGQDAGPGTIARLMASKKLSAGTSAGTLKARLSNDLKRANECERDGLWKPFDPDLDLECYDAGDDEAADALTESQKEIDRILLELDPWEDLFENADHPLPSPPTLGVQAFSQ